MIITGGKFKGRKLKVPKGDKVRPSSGVIKESLFNILQETIFDSVFIDIFAGSGSIAIEALSRGAKRVILIEKDKKVSQIIQSNVDALGLKNQTKLISTDALNGLSRLKFEEPDIIFIDPPYEIINDEFVLDFINEILSLKLLKAGGLVILQLPIKTKLSMLDIEGLKLIKDKKYGKSRLLIWEKV